MRQPLHPQPLPEVFQTCSSFHLGEFYLISVACNQNGTRRCEKDLGQVDGTRQGDASLLYNFA